MPRALTSDEIQAFRDDLCQVATRRFAEEGFAGVTMRGLAGDLGVSPMTPYRYFDSKDEIFHAVRLAGFRRFGDRVRATAEAHSDPLERLRALGHCYQRFAQDEPYAYRIMFQLDQPDEPDDPESLEELHRGWQPMLRCIEECIAAGLFEGDPVTIAHIFWVMMHGAVTLHIAGKFRLDRSFDDLIEPMMDAAIRGCSARPLPDRGAQP